MNFFPKAKFITSAAAASQFIKTERPLIAVCGKSNVGKSSFINKLANQNRLAKVSGDPGRTRLVNYFDFDSFILADLPGYGYAKVSKQEKARWAGMLNDFFSSGVTCVVALCDIRHDPTEDDRLMLDFLYKTQIPFIVAANKVDKLSRMQIAKSIGAISSVYGMGKDDIIPVSSKSGFGFDKVVEEINSVVQNANGGLR